MTISARRPSYSLNVKLSRDWPLAAAAITAFLSFVMLFPPWIEGGGESQNAFGGELQSAGPALIIVMAVVTISFLGLAVAATSRRYLKAALGSSLILLSIYMVKAVDVSDLADLYTKLAAAFTGATSNVGTGVAPWLGFIFALLTTLLVFLALAFKWGMGDTLVYPNFGGPQNPRSSSPPEGQGPGYPSRPDHSPSPPHEPPSS
ncbi:hypothetical protein [Streptomyces sp. NPDC056549]|uniref:hypothetical protein n=1 Tax=Streptomyces sp. NPDC056549 TaxID=3345864 RepID=UPI00369435FB